MRRIDHFNGLAVDIKANREFFQNYLGFMLTEQIVLDDGTEAGMWMTATNKSYDFAYTRDYTGTKGRLHHVTFALDAREGKVAVEGWTEATQMTAIDCGRAVATAGAAAVLYTDIGRDGMRTGPNIEATRALADAIAPCPVIASGGVAALTDLDDVVLTGASSVIIGRAIYEGAFTVQQAVARARSIAEKTGVR